MKCELKSIDCCGEAESCVTKSTSGFNPLTVIAILAGVILLSVAIRYGVYYLVVK